MAIISRKTSNEVRNRDVDIELEDFGMAAASFEDVGGFQWGESDWFEGNYYDDHQAASCDIDPNEPSSYS